MKKNRNSIFVCIVVAIVFTSLPKEGLAAKEPVDLIVQQDWTFHATYGGFYAAQEKGYYADEELKVTFIEGGPRIDWITPVIQGDAQIGIGGSEILIQQRTLGKPVRAIAAILRYNPVVFFALAETGIRRPEDFAGKRIRVAPNLSLALRVMMGHVGVLSNQYTEVVLPSTVSMVLEGKADVWGSYLVGLPVKMKMLGHSINMVLAEDYGMHSYARVIYATERYIAEQPEVIERFLRATVRGWQWAIENPQEIGRLVKKRKPDADEAYNSAAMAAAIPLVQTGRDHIGWMTEDIWREAINTLRKYGEIEVAFDPNEIFTMEFLHRIYGKQ